ncbi:MAG: hypothetical protein R2688_01530 [Fimbriimonadaceae bacterium]
MSFQKTELPNGIRILTESVDYVGSASIGVWCETGSRHELPSEAESPTLLSTCFKGTPTRTSHQIAEEIEGRGGMPTPSQTRSKPAITAASSPRIPSTPSTSFATWSRTRFWMPRSWSAKKAVVLEEIKRGEDVILAISSTTSTCKVSGPTTTSA